MRNLDLLTPVLLMGGIGNRLFQLARAVDLRNVGRMPVLIELESVFGLRALTSRMAGWSTHSMWLDLSHMADTLGIAYREPTALEHLLLYLELVRIRALGQSDRLNLRLAEDRRRAQIGYFQGPANISKEAVLYIVKCLDQMLDKQETGAKHVLHIRGGDFAEQDRLRPEYVDAFVEQWQGDVVCVTNDPSYVQSRYPGLPIHASRSALEDFKAIARAQVIFPSNSTFCFWASAVAVHSRDAQILPGRRDSYWQMLTSLRSS